MRARGPLAWIAPVAVALASTAALAQQQEAQREITQVTGDLYRFQNNFHVSVFLVTPEGVIATDPIDPEAASWLQDQVQERFNQPIKYLIYSHDHADHIAGGEVFEQAGAIVIAHENAKSAIIGEQRPTAVPDITLSDKMTIELGGKTVELIHPGRSHSDNLIVVRFPEERAVFTVDFISVERLPYQDLADSYFPDWIEAIRQVEALEFDILIPGHGPVGSKSHATEHRQYLEDLHAAVLQAARAGHSLDQMKANITLDKYQDWGQYEDWRPMNIEGMYNQIRLHRRGN
jgi:glyoxylase-like metal-dependent hydrolase (beta-lactamase superfamily II)